jgi:YVTN family beta-propeller protein
MLIALGVIAALPSCVKDRTKAPDNSGYPDNVAAIIVTKCATAGCHNTTSKDGAAGLDMSTWENLMKGGKAGAAVIAYYHAQSTVFLFTNTDTLLGGVVHPTMPYNGTPLSREEVITLRDWIDAGAPDKNGFVKFSDNPQRHKIYVTNQGCDLVAVFDAESKLIMRYIPVGGDIGPETPHMVRVSDDGSFWCTSFITGAYLQKFSTVDDHLLGQVDITTGSWNTFALTHDGTKAFAIDFNGRLRCVDLTNFTVLGGEDDLQSPHGSALSADEKYLYVTGQLGNFIYKINVQDPSAPDPNQISLNGNPVTTSHVLDVHDIIFSPDKSKYFLSCQYSNEVRVMNAANDSLLAVIPVGVFPQEFAISTTHPYLFVTCTEDISTFSPNRGSVYVIDYNTLSVVKSVNTGWQPHGVAVDEGNGLVYVANRNATTGGPAPHHTSQCAGRNGYLTLIDLNTLELGPGFKTELSVDPYSAAYR